MYLVPKPTRAMDAWRHELQGDVDYDYIISGIKNWFDFVNSDGLPCDVEIENYKSAAVNKILVGKQILSELEEGH